MGLPGWRQSPSGKKMSGRDPFDLPSVAVGCRLSGMPFCQPGAGEGKLPVRWLTTEGERRSKDFMGISTEAVISLVAIGFRLNLNPVDGVIVAFNE